MKMKKIMKKTLPILASGVIASTIAASIIPINAITAFAETRTDKELYFQNDYKYWAYWGDGDHIQVMQNDILDNCHYLGGTIYVDDKEATKKNDSEGVKGDYFTGVVMKIDGDKMYVRSALIDKEFYLYNDTDNDFRYWDGSKSEHVKINEGTVLGNCHFLGGTVYVNGVIATAKNDSEGVKGDYFTGVVAKIDGKKMYVCSDADHDTNKKDNGLCDTCEPDKSHAWEYSANENVLVAKCNGTSNGCTFDTCGHDTDETTVKLTLTTTKESDNTYKIVFGTEDEKKARQDAGLTVPTTADIEIYKEDDKTPVESNIIKEAGTYKVHVNIGDQTVICTITIKGPEAPQPQQGAGSSVINTADLSGDIKKIENKYIATAQTEIKSYLSASDFNKNKVEDTVTSAVNTTTNTTANTTTSTLTQAEKKAEEQQRYENFYTKMFNAKFSSTKEMSFLQKLLSAIYYTIDKIIK